MKKLYSMILVLALLLPVLAGCQGSAPAANPTDPPVTPPPTGTTAPETTVPQTTPPAETEPSQETTAPVNTTASAEASKQLTRDEAINIALKDAGLKKDQVYDLDAELDRDNGVLHYDVDFEAGGYDYDYEIDAATGKILRSQNERD